MTGHYSCPYQLWLLLLVLLRIRCFLSTWNMLPQVASRQLSDWLLPCCGVQCFDQADLAVSSTQGCVGCVGLSTTLVTMCVGMSAWGLTQHGLTDTAHFGYQHAMTAVRPLSGASLCCQQPTQASSTTWAVFACRGRQLHTFPWRVVASPFRALAAQLVGYLHDPFL